jgi:cell division GTPase FtsZ
MKTLLIGIGAAGNKAVMEATESGIVKVEDSIIINSTSKDFPANYKGRKIVLSPHDTGCGKERSVAKDYAFKCISSGKLNIENINTYTTVIICTSVEGGTGSGSTPMIAKFFNQVAKKNTHIIAFTGFEEDVRGLANTVEFFQEIDSSLIVQTISNASFMKICSNNKFRAEEMANKEMCKRIKILTGQDFINSNQNIDDTDILKVSNTSGYMTVEYEYLEKPLVDQDDFNRIVKKMIYNSHSIKSKDPKAARIGIILNIDPASEDAIDYLFTDIKNAYGTPFECFMQKQWDNKKEYIAFIASGMLMPIDEIKEIYDRYKEATSQVNKSADSFYKEMKTMALDTEDKMFDMVKPAEQGVNIADFLGQFSSEKE